MIAMPCIGALPPSFIDFVFSRDLADGVCLAGCGEGECFNRFGVRWTEDRVARERDPYLRRRVPRERIALCWAASSERHRLEGAVQGFIATLPRGCRQPARNAAPTGGHGRCRSVLRYLGQAAVYGVIAVILGYFSVAPAYRHLPEEDSQVKISFAHGAKPKGECRRLTAAEIAELAPNMRRPTSCPRERLPLLLEFELDGNRMFSESLPPTGLAGDGPSRILPHIPRRRRPSPCRRADA